MMTREEFETLKDWITERTQVLIDLRLRSMSIEQDIELKGQLDTIDWDASRILVTKYPDEE